MRMFWTSQITSRFFRAESSCSSPRSLLLVFLPIERARDTSVKVCGWFVGRPDLDLHEIRAAMLALGTLDIGCIHVFPRILIIEHILHLLEP